MAAKPVNHTPKVRPTGRKSPPGGSLAGQSGLVLVIAPRVPSVPPSHLLRARARVLHGHGTRMCARARGSPVTQSCESARPRERCSNAQRCNYINYRLCVRSKPLSTVLCRVSRLTRDMRKRKAGRKITDTRHGFGLYTVYVPTSSIFCRK